MSKSLAKQMMTKVFKEVEENIKQLQGIPYVEPGKGEKYALPPREYRALYIMCTQKYYKHIATLTMIAKGANMWRPVFGLCFPTGTPDINITDNDLQWYICMVECHQLAQMCHGSIPITGLL